MRKWEGDRLNGAEPRGAAVRYAESAGHCYVIDSEAQCNGILVPVVESGAHNASSAGQNDFHDVHWRCRGVAQAPGSCFAATVAETHVHEETKHRAGNDSGNSDRAADSGPAGKNGFHAASKRYSFVWAVSV